MATKKQIKNLCKTFKDERRFYNEQLYGRVFILDLFKLSFLACLIVPVVDCLIIAAAKKHNKELFRITRNHDFKW